MGSVRLPALLATMAFGALLPSALSGAPPSLLAEAECTAREASEGLRPVLSISGTPREIWVVARSVSRYEILRELSLVFDFELGYSGAEQESCSFSAEGAPLGALARTLARGNGYVTRGLDNPGLSRGFFWVVANAPRDARSERLSARVRTSETPSKAGEPRPGIADREIEQLPTLAADKHGVASRETALLELGQLGDPNGLEVLEKALQEPESRIRAAAIEGIVELGCDECPASLGRVLRGEDQLLKKRALAGLAELGSSAALEELRYATTDPDAEIRNEATELLAYFSQVSPPSHLP